MARKGVLGFLLLQCISLVKCEDVPLDKPGEVLISPADVIHVLAGTTAWLNWTHTIDGQVAMTWNKDGPNEDLMSYGSGQLYIHERNELHRLGYVEEEGSASIYLKNVTAHDDGLYTVRISHQGARGANYSSSMKLRVIPPSEIGVRVTIGDTQADITVADNGTDVTLPGGRMVLSPSPSVRVDSLYSLLMLKSTSIVPTNMGDTNNMTTRSFIKRSHEREKFVGIIMEVRFDVHNLGVIHIKKPLYPPAQWNVTPGHIRALEHTTAYFNWTHNIDIPDIEWRYEGTDQHPEYTNIMGFRDNQLYIPMDGDRHSRVGSENFPGSAVLKLHNVHKRDEGKYSVQVKDLESSTKHQLSNTAELTVVDATDLEFQVGFGSAVYTRSVMLHGTNVVLPDVPEMLSSELKVHAKIADTAPKANVHVYAKPGKHNPYSTGIQCSEARYCDGYIPRSDLERYRTTMINITIDFGVQNLGLISVHTQVKPTRAASVSYSDAAILRPYPVTLGMMFNLPVASFMLFLVLYSEELLPDCCGQEIYNRSESGLCA